MVLIDLCRGHQSTSTKNPEKSGLSKQYEFENSKTFSVLIDLHRGHQSTRTKNPEKVRFNSPYHFKAKSEVDKKGGPLLRGGINHASRARTRTPNSIYSWSMQTVGRDRGA